MEVLKKGNKIKDKKITLTTIPETTPDNLHALGPCFYKVIVAPSTQSHNLKIPEKYVRTYYEEQLANDCVKLSVNDGKVWRVELFKEGSKVWLSKGWECFAKKYSLKYGYFLLFRYDEVKYEYHVTIFDTTCFEIDYDQEFDNHTKNQELIKISPQEEGVDQDDNDDYGFTLADAKGVVVDDEHNTSVIESLETFKSENPHFKVVMEYPKMKLLTKKQPKLGVPFAYARVFFNNKNRRDLILKGSDDEKSYNLRSYYYKLNYSASIFGSEWRTFVRDNKLHVGDTCVFEIVDVNSNTYKATIRGGATNANTESGPVQFC